MLPLQHQQCGDQQPTCLPPQYQWCGGQQHVLPHNASSVSQQPRVALHNTSIMAALSRVASQCRVTANNHVLLHNTSSVTANHVTHNASMAANNHVLPTIPVVWRPTTVLPPQYQQCDGQQPRVTSTCQYYGGQQPRVTSTIPVVGQQPRIHPQYQQLAATTTCYLHNNSSGG
ncbi:hypothetical protein Hamer_G030903 [Homarus americanus]|uniref:Uncharacterized protein n=1 Tax=Homarus americanus TaxID=6706 RepID=A0A8J5TIU8_HOMAM|nr:hypothetical protein Hamer_G030903 [Homarus americanus]